MNGSPMDWYAGAESNIRALSRQGRWAARVTYDKPSDAHPGHGAITVSDSRTGQLLEVIADRNGLWLSTNEAGRTLAAPRRPVRQGDVVRAVKRAVELWRSGGRIHDGQQALDALLARGERASG